MRRSYYLLLFFLSAFFGYATNYNMGNASYTVNCAGDNFYDSGGSAGQYADNLSYTLTLTAPAGQCLSVTFTTFTVEASWDFLYIYDGPSTASPQITGSPFTGGTSPGTVTSTSGTLTFRFTSDSNTPANGWAASISCVACPPPSILMSNAGYTITACPFTGTFYDSGGSGSNYGDGLSYTKTFTAPAGSCLTFNFTSFDTELNYDFFKIYDGPNTSSTQIGPVAGYHGTTGPGVVTSSGNTMTFVFTSDAFTNASGWVASISCASSCSGTPTAGTATASATSLACGTNTTALGLSGATTGCGLTYQWQSSPNNATWTNITGATSSTYTPSVTSATYYRCVVGCAGTANSTSVLITPSSCILVSGGNYTISSCPFTGTFYDSGGNGSNYSDGESYTMTITAPAGSCLTFNFTTFNTESGWDFLKIYDGPNTSSTQIGPAAGYNGSTGPGSFTSSGTAVTFVFTSDGNTNFAGWLANVTCAAACSGTPTAGTAVASPSALTCGTATTSLSLSGATVGCGLTYQWQSSPNNSTWTNIAGATSAVYTPTVTANIYYRCVVSCGGSANSASAYVTMTAGPVNDLCANATTVTINTYTSSSTATAYTGIAVGTNSCATADGTSYCFTNNKNVWYQFTPTVNGNYYVGVTAGSISYPEVAIISACGAVGALGCAGTGSANYQQPNNNYSSSYSYTGGCNLVAGTTYYVMVDNSTTGSAGTFTLNITSLSNDQIPTAALIANCGTSFNSSTIGATNCNNGVGGGYWENFDNNASTTYPGNSGGADVPWNMSVENESWYQFCTTSAATYSVTVTPTNSTCLGPYAGSATELQWVLYTGSSTSLTAVCSYVPFGSATTCTLSLAANGCGFIMVDGMLGTNCDYSIVLQANPGCPLPVELLSFNGSNEGNNTVKLNWSITTEKNVKVYTIEHSSNGMEYSPLTSVLADNNPGPLNYSILDETPYYGNNYYRLYFTDINGSKGLAANTMVTNNFNKPGISLHPNPSNGLVSVSFLNFYSEVKVEVYDVMGNMVISKTINPETSPALELDLSEFSKGMYIIQVFDGDTRIKDKLILREK